ncbi:diadenosine tetraphosphate (Ap4A) HIT family hydrolase [Azospirillum baldaniorum]|uniref:HIT family protein n=1 Tax=Azospirillum baldaniorum TaxID=1064539 RepID=UPI0011ADF520|nr:HIT family protein [Azospirillum baldaniorum]TWA66702.1 diadenosine tetraphosphate (Ap4A) HIT family hydrolase [Azospirillum baldaniorum]
MVAENRYAFAMLDGFPLSKGHTLVIPRRHIGSVFEASRKEITAVWTLIEQIRTGLMRTDSPAGFNIGLNDGPAAGQTVPHLHIHIIPRYAGDVEDPRGGVRWILPAKANYWDRRDG